MICGIVIFNPEIIRLKNNIEYFEKNNVKIIFYNNGCTKECEDYLKTVDGAILLGDGENVGIAKALNEIFTFAKNVGEEWVLTFDQDTNVNEDFYKNMDCSISNCSSDIAVVAPIVIDKRRIFPANKVVNTTDENAFIDMCITSGSCTRVSVWEKVGKFDDFLFIDLVDNDFCKRIKYFGYKILRLGSLYIDQEFGNIEPRSAWFTNFIKRICKFLGNTNLSVKVSKFAYKKNVSALRVYYTNRNVIYLNKKLIKIGGIGYTSYSCKNYLEFFILFNLFSVLRAKNKIKVIRAIVTGLVDGNKSKKECIVFIGKNV